LALRQEAVFTGCLKNPALAGFFVSVTLCFLGAQSASQFADNPIHDFNFER
jgi:hypothetical protein